MQARVPGVHVRAAGRREDRAAAVYIRFVTSFPARCCRLPSLLPSLSPAVTAAVTAAVAAVITAAIPFSPVCPHGGRHGSGRCASS
ncbi:hypothetical protein EON67_05565 [archaeon]|nr:MAG: hypothetical protein EON67_05565 [archaeon]